jgi:hypothetical protein
MCMSPKRKRKQPPTPPIRRSQRLATARSPTVDEPFFEMELALAPPNQIPAGSQLGAPLVVTFQASKLKRRPAAAEGDGGQDLSGVWAYVSLMNEDRSRILAPPRTDLLRGEPAASIHPLKSDGPFAYAVFSGLTLTTPGRYCFRINIIDMNRCVEVRLHSFD